MPTQHKIVLLIALLFSFVEAQADDNIRLQRVEPGQFVLEVIDRPIESALVSMSEQLDIDVTIIGDLSTSPVSIRATGSVEDIIDGLLHGYSFVVARDSSSTPGSSRIISVYVLTDKAAIDLDAHPDIGPGISALNVRSSENAISQPNLPQSTPAEADLATSQADEMSRNWREAQEKARRAQEDFLSKRGARKEQHN